MLGTALVNEMDIFFSHTGWNLLFRKNCGYSVKFFKRKTVAVNCKVNGGRAVSVQRTQPVGLGHERPRLGLRLDIAPPRIALWRRLRRYSPQHFG